MSTVRLPAEAEAFVTSTIAEGKKTRTLSNAQVNVGFGLFSLVSFNDLNDIQRKIQENI